MRIWLSLLAGFCFFGVQNGYSQDNHPHSWQFGLADASMDKGCPECDQPWQFSLPPATKPLEYSAAYNAVVKAEIGRKRCLLVVGLSKEQQEIAGEIAKEKGFLFSVANSLEEVPAGVFLLTKTAEGKGVLTPYPTESKPIPLRVECVDGRCRFVQ